VEVLEEPTGLRSRAVPVKKIPPRKLHRGHFAFMRALAQGVDERASWERYLRLEGEHVDLRTVRRTIAWIRDAFAAAARRERKPGTARLILLDPERFTATPALPSLAEFAQAQGLEDFSEAEQIEAYEAAFAQGGGASGRGRGQPSRRTRVIERQLEALHWLERLVAQDPRPADSVAAWLHPALAERLERAGLPTLATLVAHVNRRGARWWVQVPGVGQRKAGRILDWLHANEQVLGLHVSAHATVPRAQLASSALHAVVPAATALLPYEKFVLPAELDGRAGSCRAPREVCRLAASDDHAAVGAWLAAKGSADAPRASMSSTQRSYRKEAERLLLWAVLERGKALSSLTREDARAYQAFLENPPAQWCGARHHQRWSPMWRPLEGALTPVALRQSLIILRSLFAFLVQQGYVVGNPFAQSALPPDAQGRLGAQRMLSFAQWDHLDGLLRSHVDTEPGRRLRRGMRWLYATGLRLAEITGVRCEDLQPGPSSVADGRGDSDWLLSVTGKRGERRQVPVPVELIDELGQELARHGFDRQVDAPGNRGVPLLARFGTGAEHPAGWSPSGLYQAIKAFLARAALGLEAAEAAQLRKASTHWLRHSHGAHALRGREGRAPVSLAVVQNNLGHASPTTTAMYLSKS